MSFCFATCDRVTALHFLQILYPNHIITDEENSAKKILENPGRMKITRNQNND